MNSYDPRKSYAGAGKSGITSIQWVDMTLDSNEYLDETHKTDLSSKHLVMVTLNQTHLRELSKSHPEYFSSVPPVEMENMDVALADPDSYSSKFAKWLDAKRARI
jgi:hypothetical protein